MNKVILMGRLTRDPEVRYSTGENAVAVASYTLAVDRRFRRAGESEYGTDFIRCKAFGRAAEFAKNYFHKGIKIVVSGRIETGSYTNRDGQTVYTTDVIVDDQEFAESKNASEGYAQSHTQPSYSAPKAPSMSEPAEDFMNIPDGIDEELPFT